MGFFDGSRGRLHYRDRPVDGARSALALLPGSGQHSGHYHEFARRLNTAGVAVWTLDTAGQGLSEGDPDRPGHLPELVEDAVRFVALVRVRTPDLPLTLMGHSLGAVTALAALGAATPVPGVGGDDKAPIDDPVGPALDAAVLAGLVLCGTPSRALGGVPDEIAPLPPVLAVHGVDDRRAPIEAVREWAHRRKSVALREYPDAGHDLLHERVRGRVAADIVQWTQENVAGPVRRI
ncbi:alpha/beta fold hydrolase [Nocardia sp. NPDC019395]|uniref:alpha/beta hydrolase n=1 Tax=Nocardia sp. NPDC019395 TaxID=3154686 RepID=UPI0033DB41F4